MEGFVFAGWLDVEGFVLAGWLGVEGSVLGAWLVTDVCADFVGVDLLDVGRFVEGGTGRERGGLPPPCTLGERPSSCPRVP